MNEQRLWDVVVQNSRHIAIINDELGTICERLRGVEVHVELLEGMMWWGLGILAAIFVGMVVNIFLVKRNGRR